MIKVKGMGNKISNRIQKEMAKHNEERRPGEINTTKKNRCRNK